MPGRGVRTSSRVILLLLIAMSSLGVGGLYRLFGSHAYPDTLAIVIGGDAIEALGSGSYAVNYATLYIPGVSVVLPDYVRADLKGDLVIVFSNVSRYLEIVETKGTRAGQPVVTVNLVDYDSGTSYSIVLSSEALHLINTLRESSSIIADKKNITIIEISMYKTTSDPYYILRSGRVHIGRDEINVLKTYGYVYTHSLNRVALKSIAESMLNMSIDCSAKEPYGYSGSGVYRSIDRSRYSMLSSVPEWWYMRYLDRGGDTADEDYHRLVRDVFSSVYYADKSLYGDVNDAVTAVASLIASGGLSRGGGKPAGVVGIVSLESFIGHDVWRDTYETAGMGSRAPPELALFRYRFDSGLSDRDGNALHVDARLYLAGLTGAVNSFVYAGLPITHTDPVGTGQNYVELSADLNSAARRVGTIKITDYTLTLGPDVILISWVVYDDACEDYYVLVPIATITPLYTVEYPLKGVTKEYSTSTRLLENINAEALSSNSTHFIDEKEVSARGNDEVLFRFNVTSPNGSTVTSYNPLIDIPPLLSVVKEMVKGRASDPLTRLSLETYDALASIGIVSTGSPTTASLEFELVQQADLTRDVQIHIVSYRSEARSLLDPKSSMYNIIDIRVQYAP